MGDEQIFFVIALEDGEEMYVWGSTVDAEFVGFEQLETLSDEDSLINLAER